MRFRILKVTGNSMHPTLESGAFVFVWHSKQLFQQTHLFRKLPIVGQHLVSTIELKVGDIVAVNHPKYGQIIKRVAELDYGNHNNPDSKNLKTTQCPLKKIKLRGDNLMDSVSESAMGWVGSDQLIGKVIYIVGR